MVSQRVLMSATTIGGAVIFMCTLMYLAYYMGIETTQSSMDVYIMSKCPDAQRAMNELVYPALEKVGFKAKLNFEVIGLYNHDEIVCKHGTSECDGNEWILAVQSLYGVKQTAMFTRCVLRRYEEVPLQGLLVDCAKEAGVSASRIQAEVKVHGDLLLLKSVLRSSQREVLYSATINIDDRLWCIVDNGIRRECKGDADDLARAIKAG